MNSNVVNIPFGPNNPLARGEQANPRTAENARTAGASGVARHARPSPPDPRASAARRPRASGARSRAAKREQPTGCSPLASQIHPIRRGDSIPILLFR
eukprot:gene11067-biopygen2951